MKMTLLDRSQKTYVSYLNGEFSNRFYTDSYIDGISNTRERIILKLSKTFVTVLILTSIIAYFDLIPNQIHILGNSINKTVEIIPIINVILSFSFFTLILQLIDLFAISRFIGSIMSNVKIYSFDIFYLDKKPSSLLSELLAPKYFGERSRKAQHFAIPYVFFLYIVILISFISYPLWFSLKTSYDHIFNRDFSFGLVITSILSVVIILYSITILVLMFIKFKFDEAEFDETTGEPTEFLQNKIRQQIKEEA